MKLYTEEQVRKAMISMNDVRCMHFSDNEIIDSLTPIELPSDEEIFKQSIVAMEEMYGYGSETEIYAYDRGAKWMKEQILNQNK